jgi:hypothetical protein
MIMPESSTTTKLKEGQYGHIGSNQKEAIYPRLQDIAG